MPLATLPRLPASIRWWFLLNALLLLLPPVHWLVNDHRAPVLGLPPTLFYFLARSVSIAASVVAAYVAEYGEAGRG